MATSNKHLIRNPELWIGKYVRHMANWHDFEWNGEYFVDEWTGKLYRVEDEYSEWSLEDMATLEIAGLTEVPLYCYSLDGAMDMLRYAEAHPKIDRKDWTPIWYANLYDLCA